MKRRALFLLGWMLVGLGIIGAFVPIMPTTPFMIAAAFCFSRSSPKAHDWLYNHKVFGPPLKNWDEHRAISRKVKIISTTMILAGTVFMWFTVPILWVKILITTIQCLIIAFLITRNET